MRVISNKNGDIQQFGAGELATEAMVTVRQKLKTNCTWYAHFDDLFIFWNKVSLNHRKIWNSKYLGFFWSFSLEIYFEDSWMIQKLNKKLLLAPISPSLLERMGSVWRSFVHSVNSFLLLKTYAKIILNGDDVFKCLESGRSIVSIIIQWMRAFAPILLGVLILLRFIYIFPKLSICWVVQTKDDKN